MVDFVFCLILLFLFCVCCCAQQSCVIVISDSSTDLFEDLKTTVATNMKRNTVATNTHIYIYIYIYIELEDCTVAIL